MALRFDVKNGREPFSDVKWAVKPMDYRASKQEQWKKSRPHSFRYTLLDDGIKSHKGATQNEQHI